VALASEIPRDTNSFDPLSPVNTIPGTPVPLALPDSPAPAFRRYQPRAAVSAGPMRIHTRVSHTSRNFFARMVAARACSFIRWKMRWLRRFVQSGFLHSVAHHRSGGGKRQLPFRAGVPIAMLFRRELVSPIPWP